MSRFRSQRKTGFAAVAKAPFGLLATFAARDEVKGSKRAFRKVAGAECPDVKENSFPGPKDIFAGASRLVVKTPRAQLLLAMIRYHSF